MEVSVSEGIGFEVAYFCGRGVVSRRGRGDSVSTPTTCEEEGEGDWN